MGGGDVIVLGAIITFSKLVIKAFEGKYISLKYFDDLQTTLCCGVTDSLAKTNEFGSKTMRVSILQKNT